MSRAERRKPPRATPCKLTAQKKLASVPPDILDELESLCTARAFERMTTIAHAGEEHAYLCVVRNGVLRMQKTLADGRQHIVGLLFAGDMFGRVYDGPPAFDIEAATDAEICMIPMRPFEALLQKSPELDRIVLINLLRDLDSARDWLIVLANPRIMSRLAGFLLMLTARDEEAGRQLSAGGTVSVLIPISRVDLAHLLGTRVESVSRAFHALAETGCIDIRRPDLVEIRDAEALAAEAGDDLASQNAALSEILEKGRAGGG